MKDMKFFRRKAKRWLVDNNVINGYNGLWGTKTADEWIESLAKVMFKIYSKPPSD